MLINYIELKLFMRTFILQKGPFMYMSRRLLVKRCIFILIASLNSKAIGMLRMVHMEFLNKCNIDIVNNWCLDVNNV